MDSRPAGNENAPRILVVAPSWVGDMVMAQSLFMTLAERHPGAAVDVLAPAWSRPVLARMDEVRSAVDLPAGHGELRLGARFALGRRLRREGYDRAIVLPRSAKAALPPLVAGVPRRTGYRGEQRYGLINDMRPLDRRLLPAMVQRYVALAAEPDEPLPVPTPHPALRRDPVNAAQLVESLGLDPDRPAVALIPGAAYGPAKRWPVERFRELAARLVADGCQVWVLGAPDERVLGETVVEGLTGPVHNLCGRTRLEDVVDLASRTRCVVTNDSGLMHVAAASGTGVIAIYGSSSPAYTPPLTERARIVYRALSCSPCFARSCPLGHRDCLYGIDVEAVHRHCLDSLERAPQAPALGEAR